MTLLDLYTEKQIEVMRALNRKDWFILVLHGAKRTGKTVLNNDIFLRELRRVKKLATNEGVDKPQYILAGFSSKTIQNNILQELENRYGISIKFDKHNSFELFGVKVVQAYTGNVGGIGGIRGMTSYGAYINEASLSNEYVFKEIITRCSGTGARIVCDTNPDNPEHWLKKEYIDSDSENIVSFHFKLDDNTFLSDRYRNNIKETTPTGMFYDRDINGLWVTGEGVVYKDFDQNKHYIDDISSINFVSYVAGVDWGYEHIGSLVVLGIDDKNNWYLIEEHAHQHQDIDFWTEKGKEVAQKYGSKILFMCDSARPEYVQRFRREHLKAVNAAKSVIPGIEQVAKLMKQSRFFVCSNKVNRFKQEIYNYVWHPTNGEPIKQYDDVLDAVRYAVYTYLKIHGLLDKNGGD